MNEYRIARMYRDSRVQKIYGGTNEIMKLLIVCNWDLIQNLCLRRNLFRRAHVIWAENCWIMTRINIG